MSNLFTDSAACRSRYHCATCRNLEGGRTFRISLGLVKELPSDAPDFSCPHGIEWGAFPKTPKITGVSSMETLGPALWREIHTANDPTPEFVANIQQRLPCGPCKSSMTEYLRDNPPDYQNWFDWAWKFHNFVNAKLGKPEVPLAEARGKWE